MPFIPEFLVRLLLKDTWDATKVLPLIPATTPILFLSGKQDGLVPPAQMHALRRLRAKGQFTWREFDGTHNDTCMAPGYWVEIGLWLKKEIEKSDPEKEE